ncbi:MAG TPA: hypothetical protein VI504_16070 [Candidatus Eisenbacteria bacterium]|jgi:hypothetical protein
MNHRLTAVLLTAIVSLDLAAGSARAEGNIVLPRAGQVGIGIQGQGGTLFSSGDLGGEFGGGGGLAVHVRYRMRFERAIGLTFESQSLSARDAAGNAQRAGSAFDTLDRTLPGLRDRLKVVTAGVEFYQMFDTRERTVKMVSAGAGLAQISAHLSDGETQFPIAGDGIYISAGAGLERFIFKSWAWDLGGRYMALFHDGNMNHDIQLQAGLIFYAAY